MGGCASFKVQPANTKKASAAALNVVGFSPLTPNHGSLDRPTLVPGTPAIYEARGAPTVDVLGDDLDTTTQNVIASEIGVFSGQTDTVLQDIACGAAEHLKVPIVLVTLMLQSKQLFAAYRGIPSDLTAVRMTNRDVSFCQFVVRQGATVVVNDAKADARVPQCLPNSMYKVIAYLGCPVAAGGAVLGSLCAIDHEPKQWHAADISFLTSLSDRVSARLQALYQLGLERRRKVTWKPSEPHIGDMRVVLKTLVTGLAKAESRAIESTCFYRTSTGDFPTSDVANGAIGDMVDMLGSIGEQVRLLQQQIDNIGQFINGSEQIAGETTISRAFEKVESFVRPSASTGKFRWPSVTDSYVLQTSYTIPLMAFVLQSVCKALQDADVAESARQSLLAPTLMFRFQKPHSTQARLRFTMGIPYTFSTDSTGMTADSGHQIIQETKLGSIALTFPVSLSQSSTTSVTEASISKLSFYESSTS